MGAAARSTRSVPTGGSKVLAGRNRRPAPLRRRTSGGGGVTAAVVAILLLLLVVGGVGWVASSSYLGIVLALHRTDAEGSVAASGTGVAEPPLPRLATSAAATLPREESSSSAATTTYEEVQVREATTAATPVVGTHTLAGPSHDIETVYALPARAAAATTRRSTSTTAEEPPNRIVGIALLLHACSHSALKFFSFTPAVCDECVGLSEELAMSRILLGRGYAVLAVTSSDRKRGCWGGPHDIRRVRTALDEFRGRIISSSALRSRRNNPTSAHHRPALPVVAVGASSGGRFAAHLAADGVADAAIVMVMGLGDHLRTRLLGRMGSASVSPPPIFLAPMKRDERTARAVRNDWEVMRAASTSLVVSSNNGRRSNHGEGYPVVLDEETCAPLAVTAPYLHGRVPSLGLSDSAAIVDALTGAGHLDRTTALLVKDPTSSDWRDVLRRECGGSGGDNDEKGDMRMSGCLQNQPLGPGKSPLAKALHRAWAFHEYCSEVVGPALDCIEQRL